MEQTGALCSVFPNNMRSPLDRYATPRRALPDGLSFVACAPHVDSRRDVSVCNLAYPYQRFVRTTCLHRQGTRESES
jgi:hypothetical protein